MADCTQLYSVLIYNLNLVSRLILPLRVYHNGSTVKCFVSVEDDLQDTKEEDSCCITRGVSESTQLIVAL